MATLLYSNQEVITNICSDLKLGNLAPAVGSKLSLASNQDPNIIHQGTTWVNTTDTETIGDATYYIWLRVA
jgi:hypothetical protein